MDTLTYQEKIPLAMHLRDIQSQYEEQRYQAWKTYFELTYATELEDMVINAEKIASRGGTTYRFPVYIQYYSPEWQQGWYQRFFSEDGFHVSHRLKTTDGLNKGGDTLPPLVEVYLSWAESED